MKSISIRNLPDDVYEGLKTMAQTNRRSLQEQVKLLLEQEVGLARGSSLAAAAGWRDRLADRRHSSTVELVRQDRDR